MTLIKWINKPTLINEVDHWLDSLSIHKPINFYNKGINGIPQFELREIDDSYQVFAELPGMNKKNLNLEVVDKSLKISGEKSKLDNNDENYYSGLANGKFERIFDLPEDVCLDQISAKMKDGILAIYIPKVKPLKPEIKKIAIR
tara:strand:+ start:94 stop:525 length:432 start_codon:yes stop_codon:yes gene_type:complete